MLRKLPVVEEVMCHGTTLYGSGTGTDIRLDTPAWQSWLDATSTMRFTYSVFDPACGYIVGFVTVRKERRQRGGSYWVAYQRVAGQLRKAYIGTSSAVTASRLRAIAATFQGKGVMTTD